MVDTLEYKGLIKNKKENLKLQIKQIQNLVMEHMNMIERVIKELTMVIQELKGRVDELSHDQIPGIIEATLRKVMEEIIEWNKF